MKPRATVLTLAVGRRFYFDLAINLARSLRRIHPPSEIAMLLVTDLPFPLPRDLAGKCEIKLVAPGELGTGFSSKLHLDRLTPGGPTLFLDSDILIYSSLHPLLDQLAGRPVATVGWSASEGEWFGDIASLCSALKVPAIPVFNGGLYYIEPGQLSSAVYATARELHPRYDELGRIRLRGQPNDELLLSSAMAIHGLAAHPDNGTYMADPQECPGPMSVNILKNFRHLTNPPPPSSRHRARNPFTVQTPILVHFLCEHAQLAPYRTEALRLALSARGFPILIADYVARLCHLWPGAIIGGLQNFFRPLYRKILGTRSIKASPRE